MYAAIAVIALAAGANVARAAENHDVYARDANFNLCFSTQASAAECAANETADLTIAPGDTVTWHFDGTQMDHNAQDADDDPPAWQLPEDGTLVKTGSYSREFPTEGVYHFECRVHPQMKGTVTVGNPPPDDDPSTPPSSPPPSTDHTHTPPPSLVTDTVKPTVRGVKAKALRRGVRVRFRLSEAATVTLTVKRHGSRKVLKSKRVQASAGRHTVTLRSRRLKKGRYTVAVKARDAYGNTSRLATKRLALRR